jgi:hypothetical protein
LAQLAVFSDGREALRRDASVVDALQVLADSGLTEEARHHAKSALVALSDKPLHISADGQKHVMLSCKSQSACRCNRGCVVVLNDWSMLLPLIAADQWDVQPTIKRVNESLIARGYVTWFDLTNLKGTSRSQPLPRRRSLMSALAMQEALWMR